MAVVLFDTNILIDALKGYPEAIRELAFWDEPAISVITWMEVFAGANVTEVPTLDRFIADFGFEVIHTDDAIMREAARIRSDARRIGPKIALPDAVIIATALNRKLVIVTRDKKDFQGLAVRFPYELKTTSAGVCVVNATPPDTWNQEAHLGDKPP